MIYGIGTDVCDVRRVQATLARRGDRFAHKVLGPAELLVFEADELPDELRRVLEGVNRKLTEVRRELRIDELNEELFTWEDGNKRDVDSDTCPGKCTSMHDGICILNDDGEPNGIF